MKLYIITAMRQDDFVQSFKEGHVTVESEYRWQCPKCGRFENDFIPETISHLSEMKQRLTIINRTLEIPNKDNWLCSKCAGEENNA